MGLFTLLVASASPVIQVCLMAAVGLFLARRGKLSNDGKKSLASLVYLVFAPCLTFTKLSSVVTLDTLRSWWPLWLNVALGILTGAALGMVCVRLLRIPVQYRTLVVAACAFGNVGNLPLVLMDAICTENHSPFETLMEPQACVSFGIGYVVFGMSMATLMVFSVALPVLRHAAAEMTRQTDMEVIVLMDSTQLSSMQGSGDSIASLHKSSGTLTRSVGESCDVEMMKHRNSGISAAGGGDDDRSLTSGQCSPVDVPMLDTGPHGVHPGWDSTFHRSGLQSDAVLGGGGDEQDDIAKHTAISEAPVVVAVVSEGSGTGLDDMSDLDEHTEADGLLGDSPTRRKRVGQHYRAAPHGTSAWRTWWGRVRKCRGGSYARRVEHLDRHNVGCCYRMLWKFRGVGQAAGSACWQVPWKDMCSPPFLAALVAIAVGCVPPVKAALVGAAAPLALPFSTMDNLAGACIPLMMLALGATFSDGPGSGSTLPKTAVVTVVGVRLVLLPCAGLGMLYVMDAFGVLPPEPLFRLALLLQQTVPTAIMLQTLLLMLPGGAAEFGLLLFWQYIVSVFTTPCWIMLYFKILGLSVS